MNFNKNTLLSQSIAFIAGCLITLSLAPFKLWPLAIVSLSTLLLLLNNKPPKQAFWQGWWFGFGQFLSGVSWLYISIHDQSNTPAALAVPMTLGWCMFLALFTGAFAALLSITTHHSRLSNLTTVLAASALWVIVDWMRGFVFTGFPWLYIGHAHSETFIANSIAIGGVFLASFICMFIAACIAYIIKNIKQSPRACALISTLMCVILSLFALNSQHNFVSQSIEKKPVELTLIQANIPQETKWLPPLRDQHLETYFQLFKQQEKTNHLFIFPETALPDYFQNLQTYLNKVEILLNEYDNGLLTGLVFQNSGTREIYNSILSFGQAEGIYHKQHLVPFGEYIPLKWMRGLIDFFNLPMSNFSSSTNKNAMFNWQDVTIAPFICYEIAYTHMVRKAAMQADILLTVSNDTWFGRSLAPPQHMQLAQARALENGRYLIRSTNNGITAIVNEKGRIVSHLPQFKAATLTASIPSFEGHTPYSRWGNYPLISLCFMLLGFIYLHRKKT